ncbi:hypothetical protein ENUP19_0069G0015 [Entamoeba nuttalli]|uniref:Capsid protein n=1 Tax=Entamoeba nuttalli TaxID=412467 RepID=A0ABQ0DE85_9EUKA
MTPTAKKHSKRCSTRKRTTHPFKRVRRRLLSQPNTVKLKSKLVCSMVEFIALPERDSLPQILCMAAYPSDNGIAIPYADAELDFKILGQKMLTVQSVDTANSVLRTEQIAQSPPTFVAWNPYLDHNVMGNLWDSYCDMYDYWKFSGVKIKWIPKVKTSVALPYMPKSVNTNSTSMSGEIISNSYLTINQTPVQSLNVFNYDKDATG